MGRLSGGGMMLAAIVLILFGILAVSGWLDFLLRVLGIVAIIAGALMIIIALLGSGKKSSGDYGGDY